MEISSAHSKESAESEKLFNNESTEKTKINFLSPSLTYPRHVGDSCRSLVGPAIGPLWRNDHCYAGYGEKAVPKKKHVPSALV